MGGRWFSVEWMRLHFGDCVFDSETRERIRAGRPAVVPTKAFQLLSVLIENRPRALSRDDLRIRLSSLELRFRASSNPGSTRSAQAGKRRS